MLSSLCSICLLQGLNGADGIPGVDGINGIDGANGLPGDQVGVCCNIESVAVICPFRHIIRFMSVSGLDKIWHAM